MTKKTLLIIAVIFIAVGSIVAQVPQTFKYQAVARDNTGSLLINQSIGVKISINQESPSGTTVYSETHNPLTNDYGLFNLDVGSGTPVIGTFSGINWASGTYYLQIDVDVSGGSIYQFMGVSQLLSVPYALYSESTGDTSKWLKYNNDLYYNSGNIGIGTDTPSGKLDFSEINQNGEKAINIKAVAQGTDTVYGIYTEVDAGTGLVMNGRRVAYGSYTKVKNSAVSSTLGNRPYAIGAQYDLDASENSTALSGNTNSIFGVIVTNDYWDGYSADSVWQNGIWASLLAGGSGSASQSVVGRIDFEQESTPVAQMGIAHGAYLGKIGIADTFYAVRASEVNPGWIEGGHAYGLYYDVSSTNFESNYAIYASNGKNYFGDSVGIGTQNPSALLDINGDLNFAGNLKLSGNTIFSTPLSSNLFVGNGTGTSNTSGQENSYFGYMAGYSNTDQWHNTYIGNMAGYNSTGGNNTFLGCNAGKSNTVGGANVFIGKDAGFSNLDQAHNTFIGFGAGYNNKAGNNTFLGCTAGSQNTFGAENVFIGKDAGFSNIDQAHNTFVGFGSGYNNKAGSNTFIGCTAGSQNTFGAENVFIGRSAGYSNLDQSHNTFIGFSAGYNNIAGSNTFIGCTAGASNVAGAENVFVGREAGYSNFDQSYNTFLGFRAGFSNLAGNNTFLGCSAGTNNTYGNESVFVGREAGFTNTDQSQHVFIGYRAGFLNTGSKNTFIGYMSGHQNSTGTENTFLGHQAGYSNTTAHNNVFLGYMSGWNTTTGWDNLFLGYYAGFNNTISGQNTYLGYEAGYTNSTGSGNIFIGHKAGYNETGSQKLYIANSNTTTPLIYGEFDNDIVTINDVMKLAPRTSAPTPEEEGMIYFNSITKKLMVYDGSNWQACW